MRLLAMFSFLAAIWCSIWVVSPQPAPTMNFTLLHPDLAATAEALLADTAGIESERKVELRALGSWVAEAVVEGRSAELIFICTHNSRRSHLAQVWAQVGADAAGLKGVSTFSGGTEATACNPRTVAAMQRAGFEVAEVDRENGPTNPTYAVSAGPSWPEMRCFSKKYGHLSNPQEGFAAVMTCSSADKGCPIVEGSGARFSVPYVDPKVSDGKPEEAATYDARLRQIGTEMLFVMGYAARLVDASRPR
ncbi:MAG: protein-tyrosine-phosphatase [Flavobacteriales bacterium]